MKTTATYHATIFCGLRPGYDGIPAVFEPGNNPVQDYCDLVGLGAQVTPTNFVYSDGWEPGIEVRLIRYPRFPSTDEQIREHALNLAERLKDYYKQNRVSVEFPDVTVMIGDEE